MNHINDISGTFLKIFKTIVLKAPQEVTVIFHNIDGFLYMCQPDFLSKQPKLEK